MEEERERNERERRELRERDRERERKRKRRQKKDTKSVTKKWELRQIKKILNTSSAFNALRKDSDFLFHSSCLFLRSS